MFVEENEGIGRRGTMPMNLPEGVPEDRIERMGTISHEVELENHRDDLKVCESQKVLEAGP